MRVTVFTILSLFFMFGGPAIGDDDDDDDREWARDAVRSGEAVPLADIIENLEKKHGGQVFDVRLLRSDDEDITSLYRIRLVSVDGLMMELLVDTRTGNPVGVGGQGIGQDSDDHDDDDDDDDEQERQ